MEYFIRLIRRESFLGLLLRYILRKSGLYKLFPLNFLISFDILERPHYAYCIFHAASLAKRLGKERLSVLEFGVARGNGLIAAERIIKLIERHLGIEVELYGFDTGVGLPEIENKFDLPYWFQKSQYPGDTVTLERKLTRAKLLIGDVASTIPEFLEQEIAPIGAILVDLDYYSSTTHSLEIFRSRQSKKYLPRIFMYFDDVVGSHIEMYGPFNGELRAIAEFNENNSEVKIHRNENLLASHDCSYARKIFYSHQFWHPDYEAYVG